MAEAGGQAANAHGNVSYSGFTEERSRTPAPPRRKCYNPSLKDRGMGKALVTQLVLSHGTPRALP